MLNRIAKMTIASPADLAYSLLARINFNLIFTYLVNAIVAVAGFITMFLVSRYAGIDIYGQLAILLSTVGIASKLTTMRSGEAIVKFYLRESGHNNTQNAVLSLFIGCVFDILSSIIGFGLVFVVSGWVSVNIGGNIELQSVFQLMGLLIVFRLLQATPIGYFHAERKFFRINLYYAFESITRIAALVISFFVLARFDIESIVYCYVIASGTVFILVYSSFLMELIGKYRRLWPRWNYDLFEEYIKFNIKTFLSSSLKAANQNIEVLVLGYFADSETTGIFAALKKTGSLVSFISVPFPFLTYPKFSRYHSMNKFNQLWGMIAKITFIIMILSAIIGVLLLFFISDIFLFMNITHSNLKSYYILVFSTALINSALWWGRNFSNVVDPNISLRINFISSIYQLTALVLFTYLWGIYGLLISLLVLNIFLVGIYIVTAIKYRDDSLAIVT